MTFRACRHTDRRQHVVEHRREFWVTRDVPRGKADLGAARATEKPRDEKVLFVVRVTRQKIWVVVGQLDVVNTERAVGRQHREQFGEEDGGITPRKDVVAAIEEHEITRL